MNKQRMITEHKAVADYKERVAVIAGGLLRMYAHRTEYGPQVTAQMVTRSVEVARMIVNEADRQCDKELEETPGREGL